MRPEVIDGMTNAAYHAHPALGSTSLKTLATKTPAHYKHSLKQSVFKSEFEFGTVAHSLILEQDESGIVVVDAAAWTTKAAKEERDAARAEGKTPILAKEWDGVLAMRDSVMAHPLAREAFTDHRAEVSVFWEEDGIPLKCRPDAWKPGVLIDLKTTRDADPSNFGRIAHEYGYHQSAAHYVDGMKSLTGQEMSFFFVLAEKTAPYLVSVVELDEDALEYGRLLNDRAKRIYRECVASGNWPGYPQTEPISLPMWAIYQMDDLLGINTETEIVF